MLIDLTEKELCLVAQSVKQLDWEYSGEGETAKSVLRKCARAAQRHLGQKGAKHDDQDQTKPSV